MLPSVESAKCKIKSLQSETKIDCPPIFAIYRIRMIYGCALHWASGEMSYGKRLNRFIQFVFVFVFTFVFIFVWLCTRRVVRCHMAKGRTALCNYTLIKDFSGVNFSVWSPILSFKYHLTPGRNGTQSMTLVFRRQPMWNVGAMFYSKKLQKGFVQIILEKGPEKKAYKLRMNLIII